jgi:hypothetical protein
VFIDKVAMKPTDVSKGKAKNCGVYKDVNNKELRQKHYLNVRLDREH